MTSLAVTIQYTSVTDESRKICYHYEHSTAKWWRNCYLIQDAVSRRSATPRIPTGQPQRSLILGPAIYSHGVSPRMSKLGMVTYMGRTSFNGSATPVQIAQNMRFVITPHGNTWVKGRVSRRSETPQSQGSGQHHPRSFWGLLHASIHLETVAKFRMVIKLNEVKIFTG